MDFNLIQSRENLVKGLLSTIPGEDAEREGLFETPNRIARAFDEMFVGYTMDPKQILSKVFPTEIGHQSITIRDIPFFSMCEHHMLPFYGTVDVSYCCKEGIKEPRVPGLSKIARLVECFSRRLQVQERLTEQIAEALVNYVDDIMHVDIGITATHMCMTSRGVSKPGSKTYTHAWCGGDGHTVITGEER